MIRSKIEALTENRLGGGKITHCKYDDIISYDNLLLSWQGFLCGKRNRKDVAEFSVQFANNISRLQYELQNKTYRHGGYEAFKINDPKPRNIHKATVPDRLIHHAIYRAIYPYFDRKFIYDSYSCRISKGTHRAINRFRDFGLKVSKNNTKTCCVLKCDIRKFFASINHEILLRLIHHKGTSDLNTHFTRNKSRSRTNMSDKDIVWLLNQVVSSFYSTKEGVGLPLGNLTSQLLVNIYMNEFDHYVKRVLKVKYYIRYADDFIFLTDNKIVLENLIPQISLFLNEKLKLSLHPNKVFIKTFASGVDFLGWVNFPTHRVLRNSTKQRMFRNLEKEVKDAVKTSYLGLLKHGNTYKITEYIRK